ncbi:MAG: (2Fe-2S)-binding protein [Chitinophagaceae bacterium]|nr:(2Fe-2S)-binding protein [Oligoflexus sp.]
MTTSEAPAKPKLTIDGQAVEFQPGDTIMKAAERARMDGTIPRFCYHPGLPVAGTCRMCTVEVEKAPKLMTACSTPAADGMVVLTQSDRVRKSRSGVMEFLLANHPLDCPVCDQAGECSLQDYNYEYGPSKSHFVEDKRVWKEATTKRLSDKLTLNMNRCIHCERCVRFTEDVTKTHELLMDNRAWRKELTTALDEGLFNDYQGNVADICPVGAITFNDFRFHKRVWFLKEKTGICDGCAKGCSIYADEEKDTVYRYRARFNKDVNDHWICDEGRVSFHTYQQADRIVQPLLTAGSTLNATSWETLVPWFTNELKKARRVLILIGTDASSEEAATIAQVLPSFSSADFVVRSWNGTGDGVRTSADDAPLDHLLRRRDQTSNTRGIEGLGIKPWNEAQDQNFDLAIYFRSGRATLPPSMAAKEIAWGVFSLAEAQRFAAVLPGLSTLEKFGTYTNCDQITQSFETVVKGLGGSASVRKILDGMKLKSNTPVREVAGDTI